VAKKNGFALLASPDNREGLQRLLSARKSIAGVAQPAQTWLAEQDIFGVCTDKGVKFGLALMLMTPAGGAGSSTPEQVAAMKATYDEVDKNVKLVAFGGRIEKEGHSRLLTRVYFNAAGPYAKWIAKAQPLEGDLLTSLPAERYLLAALARISPQTTFEGLAQFLTAKLPADKAKDLTATAARLVQRVSEVALTVYVDSDAAKDRGVPLSVVFLAKVDEAAGVAKDTIELVKKGVETTSAAGAYKAEVKVEGTRLAGKVANGFEHLAGGGRLGGTGARQLLRLRRHLGAEQRPGRLPEPRTGGLDGRGERLSALQDGLCRRPGQLTEPQLPLRPGLPRGDLVAVALHPPGDLRGVRGTRLRRGRQARLRQPDQLRVGAAAVESCEGLGHVPRQRLPRSGVRGLTRQGHTQDAAQPEDVARLADPARLAAGLLRRHERRRPPGLPRQRLRSSRGCRRPADRRGQPDGRRR
jgi:hypothetical protein